MAGVTPWSYSSLNAFETCPRRFYLTRIAKVVQESTSEAIVWGNEVHKALENAVRDRTPLAPRFASYAPIVGRLLATAGTKHTEQKFGLTNSFRPTTFFAKDVWFRGVVDIAIVRPGHAVVLDYKTGKPKSDNDQLKLFAATTFAQHPHVKTVDTGYLWLAHDRVDAKRFERDDVPGIWQEFLPRIQRMEHAQETEKWTPRPSGLCAKWCPVGREHCEFSGKE